MNSILQTFPLGTQWPTVDPFLFVAHHLDEYPSGNAALGPNGPLGERSIGNDFDGVDGWNMYHGSQVPGFPQHPHRGFETITFLRSGYCDHSDSLGATARFGRGDTQWMTAGKGIVHCEMLPLLDQQQPNPLELFQIWLNLPSSDKMVDPYFTMMWGENTPTITEVDDAGASVEVTVIAGSLDTAPNKFVRAQQPPPNSWASRPDADVAILHLRFEPGARWTLPAAAGPETNRLIYPFSGSWISIDDERLERGTGAAVDPQRPLELVAGDTGIECMVLQGRPIGEPVSQQGPFVMNSASEVRQAFDDYRRTQFGGWPWPTDDPNHGADEPRFARHADGKLESPSAPR
jgi:redox-sensitive bicupin YhaK (pirin superfamily)